MIGEIGEFLGPAAELLVARRALERRALGDGAKHGRGGAAAQRVANDIDPVHVDVAGELARLHGIEQHGEIARPFPRAQEAFGAIRLGDRVAVMVDADGDEAALREIARQPVEMQDGAAGAVRQQHDRIALAPFAQGRIARSRSEREPGACAFRWKQLAFDGVVHGRIPSGPAERPRPGAIPVRPRCVCKQALSKSNRHQNPHFCHAPRKRGIQYAAASRLKHRPLEYWIARSSRAMTAPFGPARYDFTAPAVSPPTM